MKDDKKRQTISLARVRAVLLRVCLLAVACAGIAYAASTETTSDDNRRLLNGSFEDGQTWEKDYQQLEQSNVPYWNTTAFQGKIELFRENKSTYFTGMNITLAPTAGKYAAELNADEESTLYQNVKTLPSTVYEWGLDHGARNGTDIMALVIGPKQTLDPSKPSKAGRDQFMQMTDWLFPDGVLREEYQKADAEEEETIYNVSHKEQFVIYSKKFGASGTFADNAGNNAFSSTPSTIYTEEWHIWIITDHKATKAGTKNPWGSYGSNAEGSAGSDDDSGSTTVDLSKYYLYTVPAGQKDTVFGFVSVGYKDSIATGDKAKTYGNFLDNINFRLYHEFSGSTTTHGSAIIGSSDGTASGEGSSEGHKITVDGKLETYITDGASLKIQALVKKDDAESGCEFVGVYFTKQNDEGEPETVFLQKAGNEIEDSEDLTDDDKQDKWVKSTNANGDVIYTFYLKNLKTATSLHFIFIKNPTVTYDPNGGKNYIVEREYNTTEAENVYSFKPAAGVEDAEANTNTLFIKPYVSHIAEGQNDGWRFMGWLLTGDTVDSIPSDAEKINADQLGSLLLPAVHTVACDYSISEASDAAAAQQFKIYGESVSLKKNIINKANGEVDGVKWEDNGETKLYANYHKGITMVAQWRWRQAFIPQVEDGGVFVNSEESGTVEITSVIDKSDTNYNAAYNANGGKSYHASTNETVTATATAKEGFEFLGWYDESGNLITTNAEYSYVETREGVNTYYARFSGKITQTYIRQVRDGDNWTETTDDKIGKLGRYEYIDAAGMPISSTATAGTGYKFVGWYDAAGNKVADDMLINGGATISYITTVDATYYARFEKTYTVKFVSQTKQPDGTFKTDNVGGKVSVASVTDVNGTPASSKATANAGAKFLGWYDKNGNLLSSLANFSTTTTPGTNNVTYYARFEIVYNPTVENKAYLSFVAESTATQIPSVFKNRDAGTGKNAEGYGLDNKYGNTISTGFKYSIDNMTNVSTIQITVTVPNTSYVKLGDKSEFKSMGDGTTVLADSSDVQYNKGKIQKINGAVTLTYYWDASGLEANTQYGFVIDNLYAPDATATITVNGKDGTKVTEVNGVVNTAKANYRSISHYPK